MDNFSYILSLLVYFLKKFYIALLLSDDICPCFKRKELRMLVCLLWRQYLAFLCGVDSLLHLNHILQSLKLHFTVLALLLCKLPLFYTTL